MQCQGHVRRRPPDEDDEPKMPAQPGTQEPEPDFPDLDDQAPKLIRPVQTRTTLFGQHL
jgi:hypothetical protein